MKIWVIGRGYPTPENKMWGSFELDQAKMLTRDGHDVSYIALTLSFYSRKDPRGLRVFEEDGVKIFACSRFYFPGKMGVYWEKYEDRCWAKLFAEAEKNGQPDLIHLHYPSMVSSIHEIEKYRSQGVRIFVTEHWSRVLIHTLKAHEKARLQYYASHACCFACVGKPLQAEVRQTVDVSVPMTIIPNIVPPHFFTVRDEKKKSGFHFVCVGRLVPLKQFDAVIRQFKAVFRDQKDITLQVIGSGSEKARLKSLAGEDPRIHFAGEIRSQELAAQLSEADALISFSRYETFAAPVAEAWAAGKPVIVSEQSGISSYVNENNGFIVSADSEEALGKTMLRLYQKIDGYDSGRIKTFAKEHFSDEAIVRQLNEMYRQYL